MSSLGRMLESGSLDGQSQKFNLLGDSAYPLLPTLLVPYRDNGHLTARQSKFNTIHSSTRSIIERAFGRLKGMFRRLKGIECTYPVNSLHIIEASFVLHNFVLQHEHADTCDDMDDIIDGGAQRQQTTIDSSGKFGNAALQKAARDNAAAL